MIEWNDYVNGNTYKPTQLNLVETNIKCPVCGEPLYKDISVIYTSNPPKYRFSCKKCNWFSYAT